MLFFGNTSQAFEEALQPTPHGNLAYQYVDFPVNNKSRYAPKKKAKPNTNNKSKTKVENTIPEKVILAIHGWQDNCTSFDPMMLNLYESYKKEPMRFISLDLPGHGYSYHRPEGQFYSVWDYAFDVAQFMERLDLNNVTLVGHSMGVGVAVLVAHMMSDRVVSLCAIDALGAVSMPADQTTAHVKKFMRKHKSLLKTKKRRAGYISTLKRITKRRMKGKDALGSIAAKMLVQRNLESRGALYLWRTDERTVLGSPIRMHEEQVRDLLTNLAIPVDLITGTELSEDPKIAEQAECVKNLKWTKCKGRHHLHMEEQVVECVQMLVKNVVRGKTYSLHPNRGY